MPGRSTIHSYADLPGFFRWIDRHVFAALLKSQQDSPLGTLVELGTFQGKSAVIIGDFHRPGERFVALDLFGREDLLTEDASGAANRSENREQYANLQREQFEQNYLALHSTLPEIVEGLSGEIVDHVAPGTARFIHVDAGHLYNQVREDVVNVKSLLRPGGLVAFDDYRTPHTPGVSAAVWQAVFQDGLIPVALTPQKLYGVYDDPSPYQETLRAFVRDDPRMRWWMEEQQVLGRPLLRLVHIPAPKDNAHDESADDAVEAARSSASTATKQAPPNAHQPADRPTVPGTRARIRRAVPASVRRAVVRRFPAVSAARSSTVPATWRPETEPVKKFAVRPQRIAPQADRRIPTPLVTSPVFLLSSLRSGSTLLRAILDTHSQIHSPHEMHLRSLRVEPDRNVVRAAIKELGYDNKGLENLLWDRILHDQLTISGASVIVDKTPSNTREWERISEFWPQARYIFLRRHPLHIAQSLAAIQPAVPDSKHYDHVTRYARSLEAARSSLPGMAIRYEDLTSDPVSVTKALCSWLDVPWEPGMLNYGQQGDDQFERGLGDWGDRILSGVVQPAAALPSPDDVPVALIEACELMGYL